MPRPVVGAIGKSLALLRERAGLTIQITAQRSGTGERFLARVELGEIGISAALVRQISGVLADAIKTGAKQ